MKKIGVKEASKLLGVSKKTVYKKLRTGQIPGEKEETKYGRKWVIDKDKLEEQATFENEVVEVQEINKQIDKEELINTLSEAVEGRQRALIEQATDSIKETMDRQNEQLERQNELIEDLQKEVQQLRAEQNKNWLDKIRNYLGWKP